MADPYIGVYAFAVMQGTVQLAGLTLRPKQVPGVSGTTFVALGFWGKPFTLRTLSAFATANQLAAAKVNFNALKGTVVTVVDHHGQSWTNIMVEDVAPESDGVHGTAVGALVGTVNHLWTRWTLRPLATYY